MQRVAMNRLSVTSNCFRVSRAITIAIAAVGIVGRCHAAADSDETKEVSFRDDVMPALRKNCLACHNSTKDEGGVNLESIDAILKGDYDGLVVPSEPDDSRLFVVAAHDDEPIMPPVRNNVAAERLSKDELAQLRKWIKQGAKADIASPTPAAVTLRPLSSHEHTTYATAMTADGRLSAAGVGNRISMFDTKSSRPIGNLRSRDAEGVISPPHSDFIQALEFADHGRLLISAGYRNVKFWRATPPTPALIPQVPRDAVSTALSRDGSIVAVLERSGQVRIGSVGRDTWTTTSNLVDWKLNDGDSPRLAIDGQGKHFAVTSSKAIYIGDTGSEAVSAFDVAGQVTAIAWTHASRLFVGDNLGTVTVWTENESKWLPHSVAMRKHPIQHIVASESKQVEENRASVLFVDRGGNVFTIDEVSEEISERRSLPATPKYVAWDETAETLWVTAKDGTLGRLSIGADSDNADSFTLIAKNDPVSTYKLAATEWEVKVGDRLVRAADAEVSAAKAIEKGESDNLAAIDKEIVSKTKARDKQQEVFDAAQKAIDEAKSAWTVAESALEEHRQKSESLLRTISDVVSATASSTDAELLASLEKEKAAAEKALKALGDEKPVATKLASAKKKLDGTAKALEEAKEALADVAAGLQVANDSKTRSLEYVKVLATHVADQQKKAEEAKGSRLALSEKLSGAREAVSKTSAAESGIGFLNRNQLFVSRPSMDGPWAIWSPAGEWLVELSDQASGVLVACESGVILARSPAGEVRAYEFSEDLWQLERTIGSANDELPFADRVLCLDVDPTGQFLATGSGMPTRNGFVDIWNTVDGERVWRFESAHRDTVQSVAFSPDGHFLATAGADRLIHVWDVRVGTLLKTLEGHTDYVTAVAWDASGRQLASGCSDGTIRIWDVPKGKSIRTITDPAAEVTGVAYVGTNEQLAAMTGQRLFNVYTPSNGRRLSTATLPGEYSYCVSATRDGTAFLVGDRSRNLVRVDSKGKVVLTLEKP